MAMERVSSGTHAASYPTCAVLHGAPFASAPTRKQISETYYLASSVALA